MNSLALLLVATLAPAGERLLPSLDYATKTPAEWMHEFESAETKTAEPLWCLYWADARTPDVIEFLVQQRAQLPDSRPVARQGIPPRNLAREIEAILTQWKVDHEPLPPQWDVPRAGAVLDKTDPDIQMLNEMLAFGESSKPLEPNQRWYRVPSGLFPLPTRVLDDPDAALLARLEASDRLTQTEAAVTLIVRRREIERALRALVLRVAADRDHGLRGEDRSGVSVGRGSHDLDVYSTCTWHLREPCVLRAFALEHLSAYAFEWATGELGTAGARALATMISTGVDDERAVEKACTFAGAPPTHWTDADQRIIADAQGRQARARATSRDSDPSNDPVKPLTWTRSASRTSEAPYGRFSSPWKEIAATADPRTRRVIELGESMNASLEHGLSIEEDLRRFLAVLRAPYGQSGADGPNDSYQAGLWVLRALHVTTPDAADWCITILLDNQHFDIHLEAAMEILGHCDLSFRQRALAVQTSDHWLDGDPRASFFAGLGDVAIERVARLRTCAQAFTNLDVLRDVFKIARASSQDLEMISAALARGYVSDRAIALAILDEHPEIDTLAIRSSLMRAKDDCDDVVRDTARTLCTKRGW